MSGSIQEFESVWDALEPTPEDAAAMRLRSELAIAVQDAVSGWALPASEARARLEVTEAEMDDLLTGRLGALSLDLLVKVARRAGLSIRMQIALAA